MEQSKTLRTREAPRTSEAHLAREVIETVALTLLIFFAVHFSVQPFRVDGPSMQPNLHTNELVLVNLLTYDFTAPQRGDVIVFHPPNTTDQNVQYIKRIVGVPGDTIKVTATAIYIDGKQLNEPYIFPIAPGESENTNIIPPTKLGKDEYFVLGDNRLNSQDSRYFGHPVTRQSIIGKAEAVVWPANSLQWIPNYANVFAGIHH